MSERENGRFKLYYRHGWAWLVVCPPVGDGRPVYHEDVENRMRLLGVPRIGPGLVRSIVELADCAPSRLVEWPTGARLAATIIVNVSEDGMSARVTVTAPLKGAAAPEEEDVLEALGSAGVVFGVDHERIRAFLAARRYGEQIDVAAGVPPVHAQSAHIIYHFDPYRGRPYLVMDFDRIDLKELRFVENVCAGDLLAELAPAVAPSEGITVTGIPAPADRKTHPVRLWAGANASVNPGGTAVHATADGNVRLVKGAIVVEPVLVVDRVDYRTGNIRFDGSVVVDRDIADGFVVEAGGDVQVGRGVGRATIRAGGNVLLKAGINGGGSGRIECGGNLFARYIEGATVACRGNAFAVEAIMHSRLAVWKNCVLNGRRSEIIASDLVVAGSVWCKKLGSVAEAATRIELGVGPDLIAAFRGARAALESAESRIAECEREIDQIGRALVDGRTDERLHAARESITAELETLRADLPGLNRGLHHHRTCVEAARASRLVVEDTIYRGAVVAFGTSEYHAPDNGSRRTVLRCGPEGVVEEGFNPAERPVIRFDDPDAPQEQ